MTKYITLAGKKQVGKDTAAKYIENILHANGVDRRRTHIVHFADSLKQAASAIFGIPMEDFETDVGKNRVTDVAWPIREAVEMAFDEVRDVWWPDVDPSENSRYMTVREILQFMGTDLIRNQMDPDAWVKSVFRQQWRDDDVVIIADCRFPNEAAFSKKYGLLIKVERELDLPTDGHISETALDSYTDYDYVVQNDAGFEDFREKLMTILAEKDLITL